jgi:hypothetical protein
MILIRNLLINRGDYAVVKYLTEDLELGNGTHVAAALSNRYVLLCTCLCIGCVTHFILDLNNRYVLPFTYKECYSCCGRSCQQICNTICMYMLVYWECYSCCGRSYQQVCNTICMYMLVYWECYSCCGRSYQQVYLLSITTTKYTKRVCTNIYFKLHITEIPEVFQPQIKVTYVAFWKVWTRHVAYIFTTF